MELAELKDALLWAKTFEYRAKDLNYAEDPSFIKINEFINKVVEKLDWSISHNELNFTKIWIDDTVSKVKKATLLTNTKDRKTLYKEVVLNVKEVIQMYITMLTEKIAFVSNNR